MLLASVSFLVGDASAYDATWPAWNTTGLIRNTAANTANRDLIFPLLGPVYADIDGFCIARAYANNGCNSNSGHAGQDLTPSDPYGGSGQVYVIAARAGTIQDAGCVGGAGFRIRILGDDGLQYKYYHLFPGSVPAFSFGQAIQAGQALARYGQSDSCSTNNTSPHLHFEISTFNDTNSAVDPYISLKDAYARAGLLADGSNLDSPTQGVYDYLRASWGSNYLGFQSSIGFPVGWGPVFGYVNGNIEQFVSSYGYNGYRQWFSNGFTSNDPQGLYRNVAIVRRFVEGGAYIINEWRTTLWINNSQSGGFLGWPTSNFNEATQIQNFEGGCMAVAGGYATAQPWGTSPCF